MESPIILSSELGYTLDNPRTEQEIELIKNFITPSVNAEREKSLSGDVTPLDIRIMLNLEYLKQHVSVMSQEQYASMFFKDNEQSGFLELIAKCWIIVRFNTILDVDKILNSSHYLRILSLTEDEKKDYIEKITQLTAYSQVISLLTFSDDRIPYIGSSFLLNPSHPFEMFFTSINQAVIEVLEHFASNIGMLNPEIRSQHILCEYWWLSDKESLFNWASKVESLIQLKPIVTKGVKLTVSQKQSPKDKFIHIGSRLRIAHEHINQPELPILLLVGNIEYLLTRNPDTNKFNVEDSISRQFKLKCGVAINMADPKISLVELHGELTNIYSLRSDFAHGNYIDKGDNHEFYKIVIDLFRYTRLILIAYIINKPLIDYLKDN